MRAGREKTRKIGKRACMLIRHLRVIEMYHISICLMPGNTLGLGLKTPKKLGTILVVAL